MAQSKLGSVLAHPLGKCDEKRFSLFFVVAQLPIPIGPGVVEGAAELHTVCRFLRGLKGSHEDLQSNSQGVPQKLPLYLQPSGAQMDSEGLSGTP